ANFLMAAAIAQAFLDWNRMLSSVPGGAPVFQVPDPRMIRGDIAPDTVVVRCYTQDELRGLDEHAAKVRNTRRAVADAYSWGRHGNNLAPHDWTVYQNNTGRIRMDCRSEARSQVFTYSTVLHEI